MSEYENQLQRMRDAFATSIVKSMTPEEINSVFQKLHDENEALKQRAEKAERERDWLLERVGVDENGVFLPCGNAKLRMSQSINFIRAQLKEGE